jgi:asparagine synthase (glutamine-hydrolysing)
MCGIAGIYGMSDQRAAELTIQRMNDKIAHRGPDDQGIFVDEKIALGHRRLAILDLSPAGHQPMQSADGNLELIFNGEIYNYLEINNYPFRTNSDSEVILAAYQNYGKNCVHHFNGMFAIAIWDKTKKELFIARDRLGIKPIYYFRKDNLLLFSSEVRSLLVSGIIPKKINTEAIGEYFTYQTVHAPETIVKDVLMLMPGHHMTVSESGVSIQKYWDVVANRSNQSNGKSYQEVCVDVRTLFEAAVKRRLISDVPFGAFLSGGIDSSAVVGLMSKVQSQPVKTFNISFDESEFGEAKYAQLIAKKFNTDHHELLLKPDDFLKQLPLALKAIDHPSGDGPNSYVVSKMTRENGITMALSGLGGDELFAGYPVFNRALRVQKNEWLWNLPGPMRSTIGTLIEKIKPGITGIKLKQLLETASPGVENIFPIARQTLPPSYIAQLLNIPTFPDKVQQIIEAALQNSGKIGILSQVSVAEISTYMQNILLRDTDQMSMASALEVRVPFLDYQLVEYVIGINDAYKNPVYPKKLLVESLGDLLPDEIVHRKKMGFSFPWKNWLQSELRSFCDERIQSLAKRPFMNGNELLSRWNRFLKDDPGVRWPEMWTSVVLENWMEENGIE